MERQIPYYSLSHGFKKQNKEKKTNTRDKYREQTGG